MILESVTSGGAVGCVGILGITPPLRTNVRVRGKRLKDHQWDEHRLVGRLIVIRQCFNVSCAIYVHSAYQYVLWIIQIATA